MRATAASKSIVGAMEVLFAFVAGLLASSFECASFYREARPWRAAVFLARITLLKQEIKLRSNVQHADVQYTTAAWEYPEFAGSQ